MNNDDDDDDIRLIFFRRLLREQKIRIKGFKIFIAGLIGAFYLIFDIAITLALIFALLTIGTVLWLLLK